MLFVRHDRRSHKAVVNRPTGPPVRLVIADVDGALVTQEKVLTARAAEAVGKLRTASIAFTITSGDRMKAWGETGAFWGGLWGLLFGLAFFLIPGIGPLLAAGPLVGWIIGALEGVVVVGGLSALGAGLYSIGIPKDSIIEYETQIKAGKFVVIAHGSPDEVSKTKGTLAVTKHQGRTYLLRVSDLSGRRERR